MKKLFNYFLCLAMVLCTTGCPKIPPGDVAVPKPVNLLLPREMRIHPFSSVQTDEVSGQAEGLNVRIELTDSFSEPTKAFGTFRFELYAFRPNHANRKGARINTWHASVMSAEQNAQHWDSYARNYLFKLPFAQIRSADKPLILVAVFSSPFTQRLMTERTFKDND